MPVFSDDERATALAALAERRRVVLERMQTKVCWFEAGASWMRDYSCVDHKNKKALDAIDTRTA